MAVPRDCASLVVVFGLLWLAGCVPLPVQPTPAVAGRVMDAASSAPIAGAVVVVRFDVRHGKLLPERDLIGHREAVTDATGAFRLSRGAVPGLGSWPRYGMEARVVGVMAEGYRCAKRHRTPATGNPTLRLRAATDDADRRESCRPVAARPHEAPKYLAAWRGLYPRRITSEEVRSTRDIDRMLIARATFSQGDNCTGPAVDLALSPDGSHAAVGLIAGEREHVEMLALDPEPRGVARIESVPRTSATQRLAWLDDGELVLWEPAAVETEPLPDVGEGEVRVWSSSGALARSQTSARLLELSDLNDERDARWQGRSFRIDRMLDPETGSATESLLVMELGGQTQRIRLPGEACGPRGQYGRPQFRIAKDARHGLDLRWIEGGCRAVAIDLVEGDWRELTPRSGQGVCREDRRVPLSHLRRAFRGYVLEIEDVLAEAGADPEAAYRLDVADDGQTFVRARNYLGRPVELALPPFPLQTPLRRIHVTSHVSGREARGVPAAAQPAHSELQPL